MCSPGQCLYWRQCLPKSSRLHSIPHTRTVRGKDRPTLSDVLCGVVQSGILFLYIYICVPCKAPTHAFFFTTPREGRTWFMLCSHLMVCGEINIASLCRLATVLVFYTVCLVQLRRRWRLHIWSNLSDVDWWRARELIAYRWMSNPTRCPLRHHDQFWTIGAN